MRLYRLGGMLAACAALAAVGAAADSSSAPTRIELNRAELSGAAGMELVSSIVEVKPGQEVRRHLHHGLEAGYVVQGTMIQYPGQPATMLPSGTTALNLRDAAHAGFRVVGPETLKLFAVHVVDKDKPLYDWID